MTLPVGQGPGQAGVVVKEKHDAFSNFLSVTVPEERGAGWYKYPVRWPVLPLSRHQLLFWLKRQGFLKCQVNFQCAALHDNCGCMVHPWVPAEHKSPFKKKKSSGEQPYKCEFM